MAETPPSPVPMIADELSRDLGNPARTIVRVQPFRPKEGTSLAEQGKAYLRRVREQIRKKHVAGAPGRSVEWALAQALDNVLRAVFDEAVAEVSRKRKTAPVIALLAVGGYGRGELAPFSDVDVLFLYRGRSAGAAKAVAEKVLYSLWDLNLEVGYAVRTVPECVSFADQDDTIRTAMLDARLVRGAEGLWADFERELTAKALIKRPGRFLETKLERVRQRHEKYGESVYLLEPNVKEGLGGIRDFQTILWIGRVKFRVGEIEKLHQLGFLNRKELAQFRRYFDFLLRVRHELHFRSDSKNDRLAFDLQPKVAPRMGFASEPSPERASERFMRRYYLVTRAATQLTGIILARMRDYGGSRYRFRAAWRRPKNVGEGFRVLQGQLTVADPGLFEREPWKMMLVFEKSQELNVDLSERTRELLYLSRNRAGEAFGGDPRVHASFGKIIQADRRVFRSLWQMHELRLLTKYMPEFRTITCHVQRDAYHLHTTDIHTLFAIREVRRIIKGELAEELPLPTQVGGQIERPHVLYLGLLFHDIGKNMGGHHSEKGAQRARAICERMGLPPEDVADVEWLVRHHLLHSHIALKRDLNDPRQVSAFASQVGNADRLDMLYLLTTADMRAVGPDIWTPWKGALCEEAHRVTQYALEHGRIAQADLRELAAQRTGEVLAGLSGRYPKRLLRRELGLFPPRYLLANSAERIRHHLEIILGHGQWRSGQTRVEKDFTATPVRVVHEPIHGTPYFEIVVYSLDVPRFFTNVAGVFASHGLSVLSADINTLRDGTLLDVFHVSDPFERFARDADRWRRLEQDMGDVLQGRVGVESLLSRGGTAVGLARFACEYPTRIAFDNKSSRRHTIIDVTTGDRIGLLHAVTGALADLGLTITLAKISTKKERADDTFYVSDIFAQKITGKEKLELIERALREAIGGTALLGLAESPAERTKRGGARQSPKISSG